jgi:hypothetical protein
VSFQNSNFAAAIHAQRREAMSHKFVVKKSVLKQFGSFDSANRFEIDDPRVGGGAFCALTKTRLRTPSRAWPFPVWNHLKTQKFARAALAAGLVGMDDLEVV